MEGGGWRRWFYGGWAAGEVLLLGGLVQGWPSLVFLLKLMHVNEHLCQHDVTPLGGNVSLNYSHAEGNFSRMTLPSFETGHGLPRQSTVAPTVHNRTSTLYRISNGTSEVTNVFHLKNGVSFVNESEAGSADVISGCEEQDSAFALSYTIVTAAVACGTVLVGYAQRCFGIRATRLICGLLLAAGMIMVGFITPERPVLLIPGMTCVGFGGLVLLITNIQLAAMFGKGRTTFVSVLSGCLDVSAIVQLLIKNVVTAGVDFLYTYIGMTFIACLTFISTLLWLPREPIVIVKERPKTDVTTVDAICPADSSQPADVDGKITSYVTSPSLLKSMASPLFLLHVLWFCVLQLRFFFFLGVMNRWLTQLTDGDLEQVDHYTSVQLYIGMASFVFAVLAGTLYDVLRHRYADATSREGRLLGPGVAPLSVGSGLCCLLSVLVLSHDPRVLYVTFLVQAAFRSTLYSLAASFLAVTFPGELFGVLYGTMVICGGVVGCLQYALYLWAEASLDSILHVNILLLCTSALTFVHPLHVLWLCRRAPSNQDPPQRPPVNGDHLDRLEGTDLQQKLLDQPKTLYGVSPERSLRQDRNLE